MYSLIKHPELMKPFFLSIHFEIQSTLKSLREVFVSHAFKTASILYVHFKKGIEWNVNTRELLSYPKESLGFHYASFLVAHHLNPQPKCEDHDIFHVLTGFKTETSEEIAMQYWLYGNGKRSPFVNLAMLAGAILYFDKHKLFKESFINGKSSMPMHHLDFKQHLSSPLSLFKTTLITINS
jgi:ubiquinone biosynthesis protein Coq4